MRQFVNALVFTMAWLCLVWNGVATANAFEPTAKRKSELVFLVRQDCGSCHGMTLGGGFGSPLLPHHLADKPKEALVSTILHGRPGTAMPGWRSFINEDEADWIVQMLKSEFPALNTVERTR